MRALNGIYTERFNRRHHCIRNLFQGRDKFVRVDKDAYLLDRSRYIVLGPVCAGVCERAPDWP